MGLSDWLGLLGGLALFLYGMKLMSDSLEATAGDKLKDILERLTSNKLKGVAVGAGVTAVIQSSSAVTVMLIGFINAKLMTINRAVWVIMGANIGTTITGQMIALKIGVIAPIFAIIGVSLIVFTHKQKFHDIGGMLGGFGILFMGLEIMSTAMEPLQSSTVFIHFMSTLSNPFLAIAFGALFTALIQSSSATMGIVQTLALKGLIPFHTGAFIVFGLNIGTCITAVLASLSGCKNSKRLTAFHILFNCFGTLLFTTLCLTTPLLDYVSSFSVGNPMAQLANMHTVFNLVTTLVVLPMDGLLMKIVYKILPIKE